MLYEMVFLFVGVKVKLQGTSTVFETQCCIEF